MKIYTLVIPRFEDIFHSFFAQEIIKGASITASRLKIDLLIHVTERDKHDDWMSSAALTSMADGILFADIDEDRAGLRKVINKRIPYLVLNNYFTEPINCLSIDNYAATLKLMDYLIHLGHRRIATITGELNAQAGQLRLQGFRDGLKAHDLPVHERYIKKGEFLRTPAHRAAEQLLSLSDRPTAIFAASDVMALEVLDVAKTKNIRVPQQLSVAGFDDNPLNDYSPVALTTVRQPIAEMARLGLEILHQIVLGREPLPVKKKLTAKLIKRGSCGEWGVTRNQ